MPNLDDAIGTLLTGGIVAGLLFGVFESMGWIFSDVATKKTKKMRAYTKAGKREARRQQLRELCRPDLGIHEGCVELGEYE
jgi:hypothetical protein